MHKFEKEYIELLEGGRDFVTKWVFAMSRVESAWEEALGLREDVTIAVGNDRRYAKIRSSWNFHGFHSEIDRFQTTI